MSTLPFIEPDLNPPELQPGYGIQRTMRLLESAGPDNPVPVKILVYGQSLSKQDWWLEVRNTLIHRYPHACLDMRNLSIGGFSTEWLVRTVEQDIVAEYPDLVILRVSGDHRHFETIIKTIRTRTCAEVLLWNLPPLAPFPPQGDDQQVWQGYTWDSVCAYELFPDIAKRYGCSVYDTRTRWKHYLRVNNIDPVAMALSATDAHLGPNGIALLARLISAALVYNRDCACVTEPVREYPIESIGRYRNGVWEVPFRGTRIDIAAVGGSSGESVVRIDQKAPSQIPQLYSTTRACSIIAGDWPWTSGGPVCVRLGINPVAETWTCRVREIAEDCSWMRFAVEGSRTGPDGEGETGSRFVSSSGRLIIEPEFWMLKRAYDLLKFRPGPGHTVTWQTVFNGLDSLGDSTCTPLSGQWITLAQGLENADHVLSIEGSFAVNAVRVHGQK